MHLFTSLLRQPVSLKDLDLDKSVANLVHMAFLRSFSEDNLVSLSAFSEEPPVLVDQQLCPLPHDYLDRSVHWRIMAAPDMMIFLSRAIHDSSLLGKEWKEFLFVDLGHFRSWPSL